MKKTKSKWTKKLPTVDGFYWWRYGPKDDIPSRVVFEDGFAVGISLSEAKLSEWMGQWYGPFKETK
jgi:hypothetical protein